MRLNLGCGGQIAVGWVNLDREFVVEQEWTLGTTRLSEILQHDLAKPLPFAEDSVQIAVAHHVLDMLEEPDLHALLGEVFRVLEPGGVLRVSSPDYENAVRALVHRDFSWFWDLGVPSVRETITGVFDWYLFWGGARKTPLLSPEHLAFEFLEPAGFKWEQVAADETTMRSGTICELDSRADESWFVEATKP